MSEDFTNQFFVCTGYTANWKGEQRLGLQRCEEVDGEWRLIGEPMAFKPDRKMKSRFQSGCIYEVPATDTAVRSGMAKYVNMWPDREQRQVWNIASRAVQTAEAADKIRDKIIKEDENLEAIMKPLARRYQTMRTRRDRIALELLVLEALRGNFT